jgi:hypothetical protein
MKKFPVYIFLLFQLFMFSQNFGVKYYLPDIPHSRAYTILKKVKEKEKINHPNHLNMYNYFLYTKLYMDEFNNVSKLSWDSSEVSNLEEKELIFLGERVTECSYDRRYGKKNIIIADQVSGFKEPFYELFSEPFYQEEFPDLLKDKLEYYNFKLMDSISIDDKKNYIISFGSKKNLLVNGSRGLLYIDAQSYAVVKYSGEEYNSNYTRYFEYQWKSFEDIWYLESKTNKIRLSTMDVSKILANSNQKQKYLLTPWIVIQMKTSGFTSNKSYSKKDFRGYTFELKKDFNKNAESKINNFRTTPLTQREKNTYAHSTLFETFPIEKNVRLFNSIKNGKFPLGTIDLNLLKLINYNDYEGFRFQIGGKTNYRFNKNMSLLGYLAFGTKSTNIKGALGADIYVNKKSDGRIKLLGFSDVNPFSKNIDRLITSKELIKEELNYIQNSIFYNYRGGKLSYEQDILKKITASVEANYQVQKSNHEYFFQSYSSSYNYKLFSTSLHVKYAPFAEYMITPEGKMTVKDRPIYFYFDYTKGWKSMGANLNYDRFDVAARMPLNNPIGFTSLAMNSGYIFGKTTLWNNYGSFGNAKSGQSLWNRFSMKGFHSLETLIPGEFYADKYVSFFLTHCFRDLNFLGNSKLQFSLVYNGLLGNMMHKDVHNLTSISVPDKYYQEVGVEFNNLVYYFGLGIYYRMGAYHLSTLDKNLFLKLTFTLF